MPELSCREVIDFLDDYVEGDQSSEVRAKFDRHLGECPYCVDYLKTYRETIEIARKACSDDPALPPPAEVPEDLIKAILDSRPRGPQT